MKRIAIASAVLVLAWAHCVAMATSAEITAADVSGKPDVLMKVAQEPNPLLLGHWACTHTTTVFKTGETFKEPIEYWLLKVEGGYALYFYRFKRGHEKKYRGWREWTLKGDEIINSPYLTIFVKDGGVYYQWKNDNPTQMTRLGE